MRFVVEVFPADGQRVEGTVQREGIASPVAYCGWLELLRLLEPDVQTNGGVALPERRPHGGVG